VWAAVVTVLGGCGGAPRVPDTRAVQTLGLWEWHGRLVAEPDSHLTLVHLRIDTTPSPGAGDVVVARYEFNPTDATGDEYALTVGLDLGRVRELPLGPSLPLGPPPARIPIVATVACLCRPLKLDSARGALRLETRGMRQLVGRLDAAFYFHEWNDSTRHARYAVHQRLDAIK
jgi:hypothetical protein